MAFRILVVDDSPAVRRSVRSLIAAHREYSVCGEAVDGIDAIEKTKQLRPDAILMDVSMPLMDGFQATQAIRRDWPDTKIIIVSQNDASIVSRQAANAGAHDFVPKAALARDLIPAIARLLDGLPAGAAVREPSEDHKSPLLLLSGTGEMAQLIARKNWAETPIGDVSTWSPTLRMMVNFLLANGFPQLLWWGPEFCSLYNDAYIPILGVKHPSALGRPVKEVWGEIWHVLKPLIETPFNGGPATWMEDIPLEIQRHGFYEETHFTIAYSPVPDETTPGGIGGVLATVHEITEKVIGERRIVALRDLGARSAEPKSTEEACTMAAETLSRHPKDVPFVLFYIVDENRETARLICGSGVDLRDRGCPKSISLRPAAPEDVWPLLRVLGTEETQLVEHLSAKFENVPQGPWSAPPSTAAVVPIRSNAAHQLAGFIIVGISARIQFDESYRNFLELMSTQIAITIANARAYHEERKRAEALAEIDRAKTTFFSNVSHEFRTPLTLMLGPIHDLLTDGANQISPAVNEQLEIVNRNGARLLRLVNTLLDFSRIEAGRTQANYQPTDLASFTAELASAFRSATDRAGLQLRIECEPIAEPVYVDRDMWEKIVLNLISNAFKFTFDGEIAVSVQRMGDSVRLTVCDTGVGIPAEQMPRLFERFHRVENTRSRTHEGSGIGLALVLELVKLHGGTLAAESAVGRGTTFAVSLPFGKAHLPAERIGVKPPLTSTAVGTETFIDEVRHWLPDEDSAEHRSPDIELTAARNGRNYEQAPDRARVVIADDNADMRQYLARLLGERFDVTVVSDGEAALAAAREREPDLILSDVMMPRLDGFGLLRELRADPALKETPFILLSARAGEDNKLEGVHSGADDYLVKPFSARELTARVDAQIKLHHTRQEAKRKQQQITAEYETLFNQAPLGIYVLDSAFRIRQVNPLARPVFSRIPDLIGRDFGEAIHLLVPKERAGHILSVFRHTMDTGESHQVSEDIVFNHESGATQYYEWRVDRIPLPDGTNGVVCYFRDITQFVSAREAVAAFDERLKFAAKSAQLGFWFCDLPFAGLQWDKTVKEHFWLPEDAEVTINTLYECLHPEDRESTRRAIAESIATNTPYDMEHRTVSADGRHKWIRAMGRAFYDSAGRPKRFDGVTIDITARKRAEEAYRALAESLEAEVCARTSELEKRNVEVLAQSQLVREFSQRLLQMQDAERRRIARELHDSAGQTLTVLGIQEAIIAERLKNELPDLHKNMEELQSLTQQLNREIRTASYLLHPPMLDETGVSGALRWYLDGFNARSGIDMQLNIDPDLRRFPDDIEMALFRIVQEGLTNIHRHSGAKNGEIRIGQSDTQVHLEIRDGGKGMTAEKLQEIRSGGAGVGFRGMRERVHQLHGNFNVISDSSGTRIFVILPLPAAQTAGTSDDSQQQLSANAD